MGGTLSLLSNGFSQSFRIPSPTVTEKNLPDQTGKVFLITGANAGVGFEVSRLLYGLNGTVYMGCRDEAKAEKAMSEIKAASPSSTGKLVFLRLNLSDLTTIKPTVDEFLSKESRLDWLDNNAGVMVPPAGSKTTQNHDLQIGTNVLGHHLLTKLLLPVLKSTAEKLPADERGTVRVSWAGSFAVDLAPVKGGMQFDADGNPDDFGGKPPAYGVSKVGNWWLAYEFGRRYGTRDGVLHNAYNPGNLRSDLQRHVIGQFGSFAAWVLDVTLLYPAVMGAYTELYAGLSRDLTIEKDQGGFIIPWGRKSKWNREDVKAEMKDGGRSEKLWDWCERETRAYA